MSRLGAGKAESPGGFLGAHVGLAVCSVSVLFHVMGSRGQCSQCIPCE